ncbi:MAG: hypothetical protein ACM34I_08525 [bacterium]
MSEKVWTIEDPDERPSQKSKRGGPLRPAPHQKSPALALSLSILSWGGGQFYNRQRTLGLLFVLLMLVFLAAIGFLLTYWNVITNFLIDWGHYSFREILTACILLYCSGLVFWTFNACQAFFRTMRIRTEPFQGVSNPFLSLLCSLLLPGWGQFLNGQVKKGVFFLLFGVAGYTAIPIFLATPLLWNSMRTPEERLFLERFFAAAVLVSPAIALLWLLSIHDAFKICQDPVKKEPLWNRIVYARNRIRMKGFIRGGIPQIKWTLVLLLFLAMTTTLGYVYFPKQRYVAILMELRSKMVNSEMVILPRLLNSLLKEAVTEQPRGKKE